MQRKWMHEIMDWKSASRSIPGIQVQKEALVPQLSEQGYSLWLDSSVRGGRRPMFNFFFRTSAYNLMYDSLQISLSKPFLTFRYISSF